MFDLTPWLRCPMATIALPDGFLRCPGMEKWTTQQDQDTDELMTPDAETRRVKLGARVHQSSDSRCDRRVRDRDVSSYNAGTADSLRDTRRATAGQVNWCAQRACNFFPGAGDLKSRRGQGAKTAEITCGRHRLVTRGLRLHALAGARRGLADLHSRSR
jgi:hypothetical protein